MCALQEITRIPNDVLYEAFDYLSAKDLKNVAVSCKRLSDLALKYLHTKYVWNVKGSQNVPTKHFTAVSQCLVSSEG
jgi:hypothetical protein